jgi:hypothetical protein
MLRIGDPARIAGLLADKGNAESERLSCRAILINQGDPNAFQEKGRQELLARLFLISLRTP